MKEILVSWKDAAPAAGACFAIISACVALMVFRYTRAANRRRATLDMVMKTLLVNPAALRREPAHRDPGSHRSWPRTFRTPPCRPPGS